jgi:hypothetical protein
VTRQAARQAAIPRIGHHVDAGVARLLRTPFGLEDGYAGQ